MFLYKSVMVRNMTNLSLRLRHLNSKRRLEVDAMNINLTRKHQRHET